MGEAVFDNATAGTLLKTLLPYGREVLFPSPVEYLEPCDFQRDQEIGEAAIAEEICADLMGLHLMPTVACSAKIRESFQGLVKMAVLQRLQEGANKSFRSLSHTARFVALARHLSCDSDPQVDQLIERDGSEAVNLIAGRYLRFMQGVIATPPRG
ncbi:MAG: hypothetical protein NT099_00970 [Candidatus Saganbacteria bacterium]|nr:hypothetical protein [Candidatus Saganbacteria bacterium]